MKIRYLDGQRLRRSLIAGCDFVQHRRGELNRINVFPVPDGDTGTNLALTASAIADRLRESRESRVGVVAEQAADAAIMGARGNCGMILSHFLLGFSNRVGNKKSLNPVEFTDALDSAVDHVYSSLERPVEGTILTVMRATAEEAKKTRSSDFSELVERLLARAKEALAHTPDLLPVLRKAGVVDAGAKGFVHLLEGIVSYMHGDPFVALKSTPTFDDVQSAAGTAEYPTASERFRFCTEAMVRGAQLPAASVVQEFLRDRGDSLIVIRGQDVLKVHIHTDTPDVVFSYLRGVGMLVTHKAEDMEAQHHAVERAAANHVQLARRPLSIVTDSGCDLPDVVIRAHGIHVVPLTLIYGDQVYRDRVDVSAEEFVTRMMNGSHATTSQPPPAAFLEYYGRAAQDGESVLGVILGSALSGTFASAEAAAKRFEHAPVTLVDSAGASLTEGLLVMRAAELAELGQSPEQIAAELRRIRAQSGLMFTVDVFDNLLRSGRVGRGRALLAGWLDIKPILELSQQGQVVPVTKIRGMKNVLSKMIDLIAQRIPHDAQAVRFGVIHVAAPDILDEARDALTARFGEREIICAPATPVISTHIGPGAWGICWQLED